MRATCENCSQVQPPDWKPGDLCGRCGHAVRREKRCHWCTELTPEGNYCRQCGAGLVPDERYGAARWLKHLGSDQFVIPERLAAMPAEQADHFNRLYQRHAIIIERHIDDLVRAESQLRQRGWAQALEAHLLPLLPLPDDQLQALQLPPHQGTTEAEKLLETRLNSPFSRTRTLAALARLRIWALEPTAYDEAYHPDIELAHAALTLDDAALRLEAALVMSHWHFLANLHFRVYDTELRSALYAIKDQLPLEAAVGLALLATAWGRQSEPIPAEALTTGDDDLAFGVALAAALPDPLHAALRSPRRQFAAALVLLKTDQEFELGPLLAEFDDQRLVTLFSLMLRRGLPHLRLRPFLQPLRRRTDLSEELRGALQNMRVLNLEPGDARELLRETVADPSTYRFGQDCSYINSILGWPALPPGDVRELAQDLIERDLFLFDKLPALRALLEQQALPMQLLFDNLRTAPEGACPGLLNMVTYWLAAAPHAERLRLHQFLRDIVQVGDAPPKIQKEVFNKLTSWYYGTPNDPGSRLGFTKRGATAYFGSAEAFVEYLVTGFEKQEALAARWEEYNLFEMNKHSHEVRRHLEDMLKTVGRGEDDPVGRTALLALLAPLPASLISRLRSVLVQIAQDDQATELGRQWAVVLLGHLSQHAPWRKAARADLTTLLANTNGYSSSVAYMLELALADKSS
ncbi:hypothetical protein SAMN04487998_0943 [Hymenobacter actinosclerus]|uniref:Uncharacterized protein n=1 Tax=Hymenobacter actinosclerus TaxID=82805 RepID=A0A1I0B5N9_9BACT|nr:hypothetical protein SAMN04487998_0943 [Hymenobacter actinosclerus]